MGRIWGIWIGIFWGLGACSSSSEEAFRSRGERIVREMIYTLRDVENHEELALAALSLKKQFKRLSGLLLEIREFRKRRPDFAWKSEVLPGSEELFAELARLYEIPGCREIIERAQADGVDRFLRE